MKRVFSILILLFAHVFSYAGDPDTFYYVSDDDNNLYSVDRGTGTNTLIGSTGVSDIESIAYYPIPSANVLYAVNLDDFGTLNTSTGAFTLISEIDVDGDANGELGLQPLDNVDGLMLDGQTFIMWGTQRNAGNDFLFQIDVTTGKFIKNAFGPGVDYKVITGTGINIDVDDLAISPVTGRMYASNNSGGSGDNLIEINKFNATYALATALAEDDVEGLAFHNDGQLYGSEGDDDRFSEINVSTGAMTNQLGLSGGDVECFASLVADANTVSGTIYSDTDLDGVLDGGETGVSGVTVYLYIDNNADGLIDPEDTRVQTSSSDGSGDYVFYFASTARLLVSTEFSTYPASSALTTDNIESAIFTDNVNFAEVDANNNFGIGTGPDCDGDGLPNFFEGGLNSDLDPVLDSCDLDSDNDGILDSVEGIEDFDDDGIPNYRDRDSDDDGIPDAVEANRGAEPAGYTSTEGNVAGTDADGNGIVDSRETAAGSGVMVSPNPDSDNDGYPDYLDLDSDNDGILDIIEAGGEDSDSDGQVDGLLDADSNGLDDRIEATPLTIPNTDLAFETTNGLTNLPNYIDIDSDSDGIDDTREGYSTAAYDFPTIINDTDQDGILDFWDVSNLATPITPYDRDSDDIPDYLDSDSDNDGITDLIEGNDANADGTVDVVLSGVDADNNGLDDALDGDCGVQNIIIPDDDYAEEDNSDGSVNTGSGDLELPNDGGTNQTVGIRFSNVDVDQAGIISSAFIQFEADDVNTGSITVTIHGELDPDADAFSTTDDDVTDRTTTAASVTWSPDDWTIDEEVGPKHRTVDISTIVQEIVNQGAWANGNSMVFIITGPAGNTRTAETNPLLVINKEFDATPTYSVLSTDYAEEDNSDGSIDLGSSDLELPNETNNQTVGVLFPGIKLSQGQTVSSAYIQFEADETDAGAITITIEGELSANSALFTTTVNDVSNTTTRPRTTASASWSPADWSTVGEANATQQTADVSALMQEIVNQNAWVYGNNMTFILTGPAGNTRTAENDPTLVFTATATFQVCASDVAHQDFDGDGEDDFRDTDDDADGIPTSAEQTDVDLSGTVDYLESDAGACGAGFITGGATGSGFADRVIAEVGITNASFALSDADGLGAELYSNDDSLTLFLTDIVASGSTYDIIWAERAGESGTASLVLEESSDGITFTTHPSPPTTNSTTFITSTVTANVTTRYIRIIKDNPPSSTDFLIDAVSYSGATDCAKDSDSDGIADDDDIDDDNDGVLDIDEGCPTYTSTVTSQTGVDDSGSLTGAPDGAYADWYSNGDILVYDFGSVQTAGTQYAITWRERSGEGGTASLIIEESNNNSTYFTHTDAPTTNSTSAILDIVTSENSFRYIRISKDNPPSSTDFEIDAIALMSCSDSDGDGIPNTLDLDSDNDGIPDLQEAGGTDTDSDGRVDSPTDTDGDGWANTFDSDDGGTALTDGDKDGDGLENRIDIDVDNDGIADIIEAGGVDSDNDGRVDSTTDTDLDGFADTFDNDNGGTPLPVEDEDGDGIQNYLDLDSDSDGIIDNVEGQTTGAFLAPLGTDTDGDGWDNRYDSDDGGTAITLSNNEGFGNPDYLDDDSDGDGIVDWIEGFDDNENGDALGDLKTRADNFETAASSPAFYVNTDDADADDIPDWMEDDDGDNVPNFLDPDHGDYHDTDNDGIIDLYDTDNFGVASILPDGDSDGEYDFRDTDDEISLPIELMYFNVIKMPTQVQLNWATISEINNDYFTIERSGNGRSFETLFTHPGAGNNHGRIDYKRYDDNPLPGYNYYRLSQTDFDGTHESFDVKVVYFDTEEASIILYPNPTDGEQLYVEIKKPSTGRCKIELLTQTGKVLKQIDVSVVEEVSTYKLEVLEGIELSAGAYYIRVISEKKVNTFLFIKK